MPVSIWIALIVVSLALAGLVFLVVGGPDPVRARVLGNLNEGFTRPTENAPQRLSGGRSTGRVMTWVPRGELRLLDRLLSEAGRPAAWPLERVVSVKLLTTAVTIALVVLLLLARPDGRLLLLGVVVVVLVYAMPELRLWSVGIERREAIANELADVLDQMSIAVEAGLGFEAALVRVANNSSGVLAGELRRTAQDMQVGQPRREAYLALATRNKVPELRRFMRTIVQAEESGLALREVLSVQAAEMRLVRRQRAEEKAQRIPVKVVFPLVFCILPVLFIVIMGPAVLRMIDIFSR